MAEIRMVNLRKSFGAIGALRGISLTVRDGELLALLGPSGCGKSTTLQILAGFMLPDGGEIYADERVVSSPTGAVPPELRQMTLVFQSYALWPHMTVFRNVAFGLEMHRVPGRKIREQVEQMLTLVGLAGYGQRYPHELSGGQQQRVALARALVVHPDTLLLDEPLSNLDANLREQMRFEIRRIHQETEITMIYVTHDQAEAMVIADRIAVMNQGLIDQLGTPEEIYDQPKSRFVASFIGQANCLPAQLVGDRVVQCATFRFRTTSSESFRVGEDVVLCVRPHAVRVFPSHVGPRAANNTAPGQVVQHAYLGDLQDLRIALGGDIQVRAFAPSGQRFTVGDSVLVELPQDGCRLVPA